MLSVQPFSHRLEKPHTDITITLPDGAQKPGKAWETTPMNIAEGISKGLAQHVLVARVRPIPSPHPQVVYDDASIGSCYVKTEEDDDHEEEEEGMLWDLTRPLEGSCKLWLLKFEDKGGKAVRGSLSPSLVDVLAQQRPRAR